MSDEMMSWDDLPAGNFVKWEDVGDTVAGDITRIGIGKDVQGGNVPELDILKDDGDTVTVTASQAQLRAKLLEVTPRPKPGDRIKITYVKKEDRGGGKTLKHFEVATKAGGAKNTAPAEVVAAAADDF